MILRVKSKAKVNLALHVIGQRSDGLHLLDSIVAFPDYGDELIFKEARDLSLSISGPFRNQLLATTPTDVNIILKAARLFDGKNKGASIQLIKNLPPASGIGGGSSNAAVTLKTLSRLWQKEMPNPDKILNLGADVPVCLSDQLQRMQGIGDCVTALVEPSPIWIVLVNPRVGISTSNIFRLLNSKENARLEPFLNCTDNDGFFNYLSKQRNDLEDVTSKLFPEVKDTLEIISNTPNCELCRMSGSGATCFGLYAKREYAEEAEKFIKESFSKAWVVSASLFSTHSRHYEFG